MGDFRHYPTNSGLPTKLFKVNYPYSPKKNMGSDPVNTIFHYPWGTTSNSINVWDILWSGAEWRNRSAHVWLTFGYVIFWLYWRLPLFPWGRHFILIALYWLVRGTEC